MPSVQVVLILSLIVMQYADNGSLLSYLDQNINKLTWMRKLQHLNGIAGYQTGIHRVGLVHCDLHGGNIVLRGSTPSICDLGLSRSVNSRSQIQPFEAFYPLLHRKSSILANLLRNQMCILLVSLCI